MNGAVFFTRRIELGDLEIDFIKSESFEFKRPGVDIALHFNVFPYINVFFNFR